LRPDNPIFLDLDEVLEIHEELIARYGGINGTRDHGMLESALAQPPSGFGDDYFHADLWEMAAAYLYHVVKNHPFLDGNKRTGAVCALIFLKYNGISVHITNDALEKLVLETVEGVHDKSTIAEFLKTSPSEERP
jgi:death-on-curing protein